MSSFLSGVAFLTALYRRYGDVPLLVMSNELFASYAQQVIQQLESEGKKQILHYPYSVYQFGEGCHWHPSVKEHQRFASDILHVISQSGLQLFSASI
ncbi:SGNH/GDSL hydrolase family protein [Photobacterium sp. R1]